MRIAEVETGNVMAVLEPDWRRLQAQCQRLTPFQTWEWNAAWWRHFGALKTPHILLFWAEAPDGNGEILVGIAPCYTSFHLGTPLRRLAWIGTGQSDYMGPLACTGWEERVAGALRFYIDTTLRGWHMADLQQMRPDEPLLVDAIRMESEAAVPAQTVLPIEPCPYLLLPAEWKLFTDRLGKKMRSNLGYYDRLLCRTFKTVAYQIADTTTLDAGLTALFTLHQKRWNARWLPGVLGNQRVQAFHRDVAQAFLANGWLRLHLLSVDGVIQAVLYCFALGGHTYYYLGGFALEMSRYSLGTLLTGRAIRQAIEEHCTEFDFLRGDESYKYRWLPTERINHRMLLLRTYGKQDSRRDEKSREDFSRKSDRKLNRKLSGLRELPGQAGLALHRVERYVAARAKAFAEHRSAKHQEEKQP